MSSTKDNIGRLRAWEEAGLKSEKQLAKSSAPFSLSFSQEGFEDLQSQPEAPSNVYQANNLSKA